VTGGPTREKIDEVRDWGNIFSGQTGLDLALAFLEIGDVTLLTSNAAHAKNYDGYYGKAGMLGVETFRTYEELRGLLAERMTPPQAGDGVDIAAMTAAVSDYAPGGVYRIIQRENTKHETQNTKRETWIVERADAPKVKSDFEEIAVRGVRTAKLIDMFRSTWGFAGILIKFKLEVAITEEQLVEVAAKSRTASAADLMVANTLAMARGEGVEAGAYLIDDGGAVRVGRKEMAAKIAAWCQGRLASK
jgi:phosphopantothenate-cysteine ligase/phosphopantothenoylcysteine decarboxylase/phosphopantothenate--cysteine ligase